MNISLLVKSMAVAPKGVRPISGLRTDSIMNSFKATLVILAGLTLAMLSMSSLEAQGGPTTTDYVLWWAPKSDCTAGGTVIVDLYLEILPSAPAAGSFDGFSIGMCHDTDFLSLDPASITLGNWVNSLVPCINPQFLEVLDHTIPGSNISGYSIGTVFSFTGGCTLPVGCHLISSAEYSCSGDFALTLPMISTCDLLGSPPITTGMVVNGALLAPIQEFLPSEIPLECNSPSPGLLQLNWTGSNVFDSYQVICDGVPVATLPGDITSYTYQCNPTQLTCCIVVGTTSCGVTYVSNPCCCGSEPCIEILEVPILECNTTGPGHILTINFVNLSGLTANKVVIPGTISTSSGTATVLDNVIVFSPEIQDGDSGSFMVRIDQAIPGDTISVPFALLHKTDSGDVVECCSAEITAIVPPCDQEFIRCDNNRDGACNIADAVFLLSLLFSGGATCSCDDACDCNDDGSINIADAIFKLGFLFSGAGPIPSPFPQCGPDPTPDNLDCQAFPPCP